MLTLLSEWFCKPTNLVLTNLTPTDITELEKTEEKKQDHLEEISRDSTKL